MEVNIGYIYVRLIEPILICKKLLNIYTDVTTNIFSMNTTVFKKSLKLEMHRSDNICNGLDIERDSGSGIGDNVPDP